MDGTETNGAKIKVYSDKINELTDSLDDEIENTQKSYEMRSDSESNIIHKHSKQSLKTRREEPNNTLPNDFSNCMDKILKSLTDLKITDGVDDKNTNIRGSTSACTVGKEKVYIDLNIQTQQQPPLHNLDIDSDDHSDEHCDSVDVKISGVDTKDSDYGIEYSEDEKEFNDSQFSNILDRFMMSDSEDIDLEAKLEKNVLKTMIYFSRKFILNSIVEEREIEMEKLLSFIYQIAGCNPKKYTDFEKRFAERSSVSATETSNSFTKFKEQIDDEIENTQKSYEVRISDSERNIIHKHSKQSFKTRREKPNNTLPNDFSNCMEPVDKILKSLTNLKIPDRVDDKDTNIRVSTSACTVGKEKAYIDLNIQTQQQQPLYNFDIDSDDYSDEHYDSVDVKISGVDIIDSDNGKEYSEDEKEFTDSQFSNILDRFMMSDSEDIDLEAKLEKNVLKTMNYFSRKFIIDSIEEEREIEMEKLLSFIYQIAGCNPEKYTDFEKRFAHRSSVLSMETSNLFTKFKEQFSNMDDASIFKLSVPTVYLQKENETDSTKNKFVVLVDVVKKGDLDEFKTFINKMTKDSTTFFSQILIDGITLSCKYNAVQIFDYILQELLSWTEMIRKHLAFNHALYMNDVDLLERIYFYYSGNLHWLGTEATDMKNYQENIVWNLKLLNIILCNSKTNSPDFNEETLFYLDSLINFNSFQVTLYTNLALSKKKFISLDQVHNKTETQINALNNIVLDILKIYEFYMNKREIKEIHIQVPLWMRDVLDNNALNFNFVDNLVRELYFKRIDLNVCLILLDNLNLLEERLTMPSGVYKDVKSRIYHFIYHLSKDWSDFMPNKNKESLKFPFLIDSGHLDKMSYNIDLIKLSISPLIYLERQEFHNCLNNFKDGLKKVVIKSNTGKKLKKNSNDAHSLNILPYITDEVCLEKMLYYMHGLYKVDLKKERKSGQLIILRIIQILGEFLKDSEESAHLSQQTIFFLQAKVSPYAIKLLKKIRDKITHVNSAQLLNKIDVEQNEINEKIFCNVLIELKKINSRMIEFLKIHKFRAKKASIKDALNLLQKRLNKISKFENQSQCNVHEIQENGYFKQIWRKNSSNEQYVEEFRFLETNKEFLMFNLKETTDCLKHHVLKKLPFFIQKIRKAIEYIDKPEIHDAINIDEYEQWGIIKEILRFIVKDAAILENHPYEVKKGRCSSLFEYIVTTTPNEDGINNVNSIILMVIESAEMYGFDRASIDKQILFNSEATYYGLAQLNKTLNRTNFLTVREQKAVLNNISKIMESCVKLKDKINSNEPISKKEYAILLKNLTLKSQSETHLSNLVLGKPRSLVLLECLSDRVSLLKEILNAHSSDHKNHHLIYLNNQKYQLIVEALLFDIMNIFNDNNQKMSLKKTSKFLAEVNLRNVLSHGNPLLELAGDVIDDKDLPVELMTRALRYAQDEDSIKALAVLIRQNVDPSDIKKEIKTLSKDVQNLIKEFKKSQQWQEYLLLAIKDYNEKNSDNPYIKKESNLSNQTTGTTKFDKKNKHLETIAENKLLKAVQVGDLEEVKSLVKTIANTNARDAFGKGCLHYAAMKGRADMIEVLVRGSADVRCEKDGRSALHYAAMNGHTAAARALLSAGADVTVLDKRGKTPRDYAADDVMRTILNNDH